MAMAQVFIPNPHDSIPPSLHLHTPPSPSLPSPPLSASCPLHDDDHIPFLPRAPPPSPELPPKKIGSVFEIDPSKFETPRKSELPPSPTNSLDFSTIFTPNKSPLESEPQSPMQPSPSNPLDSAYCSAQASTSSRQSNTGFSSQSIPISPNSANSSCYSSMVSYSHSDADSFRNGLRSHTALAQHPNSYDSCPSSIDAGGPLLRPRSHTHPTQAHTGFHRDQPPGQDVLQSFHPHLPLSFDTTQLQYPSVSPEGTFLDSGYHETTVRFPSQRKKHLKRKSNELGYDGDPMELFNYDSYSETSSESEWLVTKGNKKACPEGENPIMRRQSSSFSGVFTYSNPLPPISDGLANASAPPTPNHCTTPLLQQDFSLIHHSSLSPPVFSPHQTPLPPTPTPSTEVPTSLNSMEVAEQGVGETLDSLDSMDCGTGGGEHCVDMDSLSSTLRGSHLEHTGSHTHHFCTHIVTVSSPPPSTSVPSGRSYSSGDGYNFSQEPLLADETSSNVLFSSYHEGGSSCVLTNTGNGLVLSKSL